MYDITSRQSFDDMKLKFYPETIQNTNADTITFVIGTKTDLSDQRQVGFEEA